MLNGFRIYSIVSIYLSRIISSVVRFELNDPQEPSSQSVCITVNLVVKDKYFVLLEITSHVDTQYGAANAKSSWIICRSALNIPP